MDYRYEYADVEIYQNTKLITFRSNNYHCYEEEK